MKLQNRDFKMQYIKGRVGLKPFTKEDLYYSNYKNWLNDPEVNKYMYRGKFHLTDNNIEEIFDSIDNKEKVEWAIYYLEKKNSCIHVGNVSIENIDFMNSSAEIIIILGEKGFWKKGIGTIAFGMTIQHGFMKLKLHRLYAGTHEDNKGMIKIFEKNNMQYEGSKEEAYKEEDEIYSTTVHYRILSPNYFNMFKNCTAKGK